MMTLDMFFVKPLRRQSKWTIAVHNIFKGIFEVYEIAVLDQPTPNMF